MRGPAIALFVIAAAAPLAARPVPTVTVLRSVYFAPAVAPPSLPADSLTLLKGAPEMLATTLSAQQPFARVDAPSVAQTVISVDAETATDGAVAVSIRLADKDGSADKVSRNFAADAFDLAAFVKLIEEAGARFSPRLGPMTIEIDVLKITGQQETFAAAKEVDYFDQLDKRFAFTLWASGLLRLLDSSGVEQNGAEYFSLNVFPLIAEADWFFSRNFGVLASFYFNDTNSFDFGQHSRGAATGVFLFPGAGVVFRTLGRVSTEYAFTLSAGFIHLSADAGDVLDQSQQVVLPKGSSTWSSLGLRLRFAPALVWNITPSLALKSSIGIDFILPGLSWYNSPLGDFQFLGLGIAWRI